MSFFRVFDSSNINTKLLQSDSNFPLQFSSVLASYVSGSAVQISPIDPDTCSGLQLIEGHDHNIHVHRTQTGNHIVFFTDVVTTFTKPLFDACYTALVDTVLRHPTYELDHTGAFQTITAKSYEVFAKRVDDIVASFVRKGGAAV